MRSLSVTDIVSDETESSSVRLLSADGGVLINESVDCDGSSDVAANGGSDSLLAGAGACPTGSLDVRGHLLPRQGTWRLQIEPAALRFVRLPPQMAEKPPSSSGGSDSPDAVVEYHFSELAGVGFISDGGSCNRYLCAYRYQRKESADVSRRAPRQRQLVLFRITRPSDIAGVALIRRLCADAIGRSIGRQPGQAEKPLLVLLNPHSGQGKAERLFREKAAPVLQEAGLPCRLVRTEFAGHATQLLRDSAELDSYSGLVIVSGDGLLYEALNGLAARPDWRRALRLLPFAVLPAGGGNAMAASLAHANGDCLARELVTTAAFNLTKSRPRPVDLALVESASGARRIACLSVNYGMLAQVDLDSERYRFMGLARFAFAFGLRLMSPQLRTYRARLSYLPADDAAAAPRCGVLGGDREDKDGGGGGLASLKRHLPASLAEPLPSSAGWVSLEADFLLVLVSLQSHLATDNFYMPPCRPNDGRLYVTWVAAGVTKASLLRMFLRVEDGGHLDSPGFRCAPALAFRLEPISQGQVCIDGERADCEPMQGELVPGLGAALMPEMPAA